MAIKIYEKFAPRANPASADYPYGSIKNESVLGAKDGTPLDAAWGNDYAGFDAALFAEAGITPSGQPDKLGASQRVDAMVNMFGITFKTVADMKAATSLKDGQRVIWQGYYSQSDGGGNWGIVKSGAHTDDGGSIFSIGDDIYIEANLKGRRDVNVMKFGADRTGKILANDAFNAALNYGGGAAFVPEGTFWIENFERDIQGGNRGQSKCVLTGLPTPRTANHQYMQARSVIEGDGDIFLEVVNFSFTNIGVRNRGSSLGGLFNMWAMGAEGGRWDNCYFGNCKNHFVRNKAGTNPALVDYIIGPQFRQCAFFHATGYSRKFDGVVAGYREDGCYTSHCVGGVYMQSPGPGCSIESSIFEYVYDHAIEATVYGSVANYTIQVNNTFFESLGGATTVSIPNWTNPANRPIAYPSVKLGNLSTTNGAELNVSFNGCFWTYTDTNKPTCHIFLKDANNLNLEFFGNKTQTGVEVFSTDAFVPTPPDGVDGIRIRTQNAKGALTTKGLAHAIEDVPYNRVPASITKQYGDVMSIKYCDSENVMYDQWSNVGRFDHKISHSSAKGISFKTTNAWDDVSIKAGYLTIHNPGAGIILSSPDGTQTKALSLDNSGNLVVN